MEAPWIKNYGDDLYLQCTYTCIRVLDRGLAHARKNDKVRRHRPGRDETTPPTSIEDLLMQARMIRYDVIGLAETRRRHPFNAVYDAGEELSLRTCDSRGVGDVGFSSTRVCP
uniref:Uncharacterized protein n=1 Tax=Angiostrongylus cantonensis TaxID=6313 RepID=A0A0K0D754_ANGCA